MKTKSDAEILRDAKLEALGLLPDEKERRPHRDRPQMATDEMVSIETLIFVRRLIFPRSWNVSKSECVNDI